MIRIAKIVTRCARRVFAEPHGVLVVLISELKNLVPTVLSPEPHVCGTILVSLELS